MPSSEPDNLPLILHYARCHKPESILDVGVGCGKYGMLFREYLDGHWVGRAFHDKETWKLRIIGIEIFAEYLTPIHQYVYDEVFICDYKDYVVSHPELFDLIMMGDVLEHFDKEVALRLLRESRNLLTDRGAIVISTPNFDTNLNYTRPGIFGNQHENHRCRLLASDFSVPGMRATVSEGRLLTVILEKQCLS